MEKDKTLEKRTLLEKPGVARKPIDNEELKITQAQTDYCRDMITRMGFDYNLRFW